MSTKRVKSVTLNIGHDPITKEQAISTTYDLENLGYEIEEKENEFITACTFDSETQMTIRCAENPNQTQRTNTLRVKLKDNGKILDGIYMTVNQQGDPGSSGNFTWGVSNARIAWTGGNLTNDYMSTYGAEDLKFTENTDLYGIVYQGSPFVINVKKNNLTEPRDIVINAYTGETEETGKIVGTWTITQEAMPSEFYFRWDGENSTEITKTTSSQSEKFTFNFTSNYENIYSKLSDGCFFRGSYNYKANETLPLSLTFSKNEGRLREGTIYFYSDEACTENIASLTLKQMASSGDYFILGDKNSNNYEVYAHVSGGTLSIELSTTYDVNSITCEVDKTDGYGDPNDSSKKTHIGEYFLSKNVEILDNEIKVTVDESYYRLPLSRDIPRGMIIKFNYGGSRIGTLTVKQIYYYFAGNASYIPIPYNYPTSVSYIYTNIPKLMYVIEQNSLNLSYNGYSIYTNESNTTISSKEIVEDSKTEVDGITQCKSYKLKIMHGQYSNDQKDRLIIFGVEGLRRKNPDGKYFTTYEELFRFTQEHAGEKVLLIDFFEKGKTAEEKIDDFRGKTEITLQEYENNIGTLDWDLYPGKDKSGDDLNDKYFHFLIKTNYFLTSPEMSRGVIIRDSLTEYYETYIPLAGIIYDGGYNKSSQPAESAVTWTPLTYDNGVTDPDSDGFNFDPRQMASPVKVSDKSIKVQYKRIGYEQTPNVTGYQEGFDFGQYYLSFDQVDATHTAQTKLKTTTIGASETTARVQIYSNIPAWYLNDYDTSYYSAGTNCSSVKIIKNWVEKDANGVIRIKPELLVEGITGETASAQIWTHTKRGGTASGYWDRSENEQRLILTITKQ